MLGVGVGGKPYFMLVMDQVEDVAMLCERFNMYEVLEKVACNIINTFSDIETRFLMSVSLTSRLNLTPP